MRRLFFRSPEDWLGDDLGPVTAPEFTKYAFLDGSTYVNEVPEDNYVEPIAAEQRLTLPAGIWFVNHYLWTYANQGTTEIKTVFRGGDDCGGTI